MVYHLTEAIDNGVFYAPGFTSLNVYDVALENEQLNIQYETVRVGRFETEPNNLIIYYLNPTEALLLGELRGYMNLYQLEEGFNLGYLVISSGENEMTFVNDYVRSAFFQYKNDYRLVVR